MSKRINVNPDHYKVGGRERPGHQAAKAPKELGQDEKARARWSERMRARERSTASNSSSTSASSPKSPRRG